MSKRQMMVEKAALETVNAIYHELTCDLNNVRLKSDDSVSEVMSVAHAYMPSSYFEDECGNTCLVTPEEVFYPVVSRIIYEVCRDNPRKVGFEWLISCRDVNAIARKIEPENVQSFYSGVKQGLENINKFVELFGNIKANFPFNPYLAGLRVGQTVYHSINIDEEGITFHVPPIDKDACYGLSDCSEYIVDTLQVTESPKGFDVLRDALMTAAHAECTKAAADGRPMSESDRLMFCNGFMMHGVIEAEKKAIALLNGRDHKVAPFPQPETHMFS